MKTSGKENLETVGGLRPSHAERFRSRVDDLDVAVQTCRALDHVSCSSLRFTLQKAMQANALSPSATLAGFLLSLCTTQRFLGRYLDSISKN